MNQEKTKYILNILYKIYKDGYRPARKNESYNVKLKNGFYAGSMINCMGHIFNLRNKQFNDYKIEPYNVFDFFGEVCTEPYFMDFLKYNNKEKNAQLMLDFIKETGLKVAECAPDEMITDFKSWKIALYFSKNDFHYLIEDVPGHWSGKDGDTNIVEFLKSEASPKKYCHTKTKSSYELYCSYKITNKNANENNIYVNDREL